MDESAFRIAIEALTVGYRRYAQVDFTVSDRDSRVLSVAEKLSAGEFNALKTGASNNAPSRVMTIFDSIGSAKTKPAVTNYLPLRPLSASESSLFPSDRVSPAEDAAAIARLKANLSAAFQDSEPDKATRLERMLSALR